MTKQKNSSVKGIARMQFGLKLWQSWESVASRCVAAFRGIKTWDRWLGLDSWANSGKSFEIFAMSLKQKSFARSFMQ